MNNCLIDYLSFSKEERIKERNADKTARRKIALF